MGEDEDEVRRLLICSPGFRAPSVPSVEMTCGDCEGPVWVSLPMAPRAQRGEATPTCENCMRKRVLRGDELAGFEIWNEQRAQLREVTGLSDAGLDKLSAEYLREQLRYDR